jgi:hypothetical protein
MSAYKDALALDRHSPPSRVTLAAELLERCEGIVLVEGLVALRPTATAILCEVIDSAAAAHRCAEEYRVLVENAARCLEKSDLRKFLPDRPLRWVVVDEYGTRLAYDWLADGRRMVRRGRILLVQRSGYRHWYLITVLCGQHRRGAGLTDSFKPTPLRGTAQFRCLGARGKVHAKSSCLLQLRSACRTGRRRASAHLHLPLPGLSTPNRQCLCGAGQVSPRKRPALR